MPARLAIMLSGSGTTYANLAEACRDGRLAAEIVVVISSRAGIGGVAKAETFGHHVVIATTADEVTAALRQQRAEWVAMCGWLKYWDPPADFAQRTLNIHPSLLPAYGGQGMYGRRVHAAVLAAKETLTGCTAHLVSGDYDGGTILAQETVPVAPDDTPDTLQLRVQAAECSLYPRVLDDLIAGRIRPAPSPCSASIITD